MDYLQIGAVSFEDGGGEENPTKSGDMIFEAGGNVNLTMLMGAMIFEAGSSGNVKKLMEIKQKMGDESEYWRICDARNDGYTGRRILHIAAEKGYLQTCKFLVGEVKVRSNIRTYRGYSSYLSCEGGNMNLIHHLVLKCKASLEVDSVDGTPLQCAASRGHFKAFEFLIVHGLADVDSLCSKFGSPLISALQSQSIECVKLLLERKANPNKKVFGMNAWAQAARGDPKFLHLLLKRYAAPRNVWNSKGLMSPIEYAASASSREAVEMLFPKTNRIHHFPIWTVDGILEYYASSGCTKKRQKSRRSSLSRLIEKAKTKQMNERYSSAAWYFTEALHVDPTNQDWLATRSFCLGELGYHIRARHDAVRARTD